MTAGTINNTRAHLQTRLHDYHSVTLAEVLEVVAYLRNDDDSVIAGGSLVIGLGNRLSDLDILIVGEKTITSSRVPLEHFVKTLRVDAWVMSQELIDDVFKRAERGLSKPGRLDELFANVDDEVNLKLLHRIAFGITLDGPSLRPSCARDHGSIAREAVVREYLERMREHAFLAQLAAAHNRGLNATINARDAIEEALHAVITAQGIAFTGHKWLQERLQNDVPALGALYQPFATLPADNADWRCYVRDAVAQCQALTGIRLDSDELTPHCSWVDTTELRAAKIGDRRMLLSVAAGGLWELELAEAQTWAELTSLGSEGSPIDWSCATLTPPQLALCFALYEQGLLTLRWSQGVPTAALDLTGGDST